MKELVRKIKSTGLKLDDWQAEGLATWAQAAVRKFAQGRSFEDILNFPANRVAAYLSDLSDEDLQLLNEDLGGKMAESIREKIKGAAARPPRQHRPPALLRGAPLLAPVAQRCCSAC